MSGDIAGIVRQLFKAAPPIAQAEAVVTQQALLGVEQTTPIAAQFTVHWGYPVLRFLTNLIRLTVASLIRTRAGEPEVRLVLL